MSRPVTATDRPTVTDYPDASEVLDVIYEAGYASSSTVQRKLGLTFRQAEDVLAALSRYGIVGKAEDSRARKILVTRPEAEAILGMDDPEAMASEAPAQAHPSPSVTDDARAVREAAISLYRAMRRANPDAWAEVDEVEDWAYWDDIVRTAQVTLAAGRVETSTEDTVGELLERMSNAVTRLEALRAEHSEASERQRLHGKIEGVKLAASYVEEARGLLATAPSTETNEARIRGGAQ